MNLGTHPLGCGHRFIIVSHDMDEIAENCNRAAVFADGKVLSVAAPCELFKEFDKLSEKGLDVPFTAKLTRALEKKGVAIENDFTESDFVQKMLAYAKTAGVGTELTGGADHA